MSDKHSTSSGGHSETTLAVRAFGTAPGRIRVHRPYASRQLAITVGLPLFVPSSPHDDAVAVLALTDLPRAYRKATQPARAVDSRFRRGRRK